MLKSNKPKDSNAMFEFECWHENDGERWATQRYIAASPTKAKTMHYAYLQDGLYEGSFFAVVRGMKCKKIRKADVTCLFGETDTFERVKKVRGLDFAFMGMRVLACGKMGCIVGGNESSNLDVVFDGEYHKINCHPYYEIVYYDKVGNIVADYREEHSR